MDYKSNGPSVLRNAGQQGLLSQSVQISHTPTGANHTKIYD